MRSEALYFWESVVVDQLLGDQLLGGQLLGISCWEISCLEVSCQGSVVGKSVVWGSVEGQPQALISVQGRMQEGETIVTEQAGHYIQGL